VRFLDLVFPRAGTLARRRAGAAAKHVIRDPDTGRPSEIVL